MRQPVFIAHRGGWLPGRRENTTAAIERAASSGRFAYIELDVRRTRANDSGSKTAVLLHDESLDRLYDLYRIPLTKRHQAKQKVDGLTIDILRSEDIDIATLAEAMRSASGQPLNLELKQPAVIEPALETIQDMIQKYPEWDYEKIVISSMDWSILTDIKKREPRLGLAMIYSWRHLPRSFGRQYHRLGARWIVFNKWLAPLMSLVARPLAVHHRGAYTINNRLVVKFLALFGVEIFFTDSVTLPDSFSAGS